MRSDTQEPQALRKRNPQVRSQRRGEAEELFRRPSQAQSPSDQIKAAQDAKFAAFAARATPTMKGTKSQPGPGAIQRRKDFIRLINKRVPMAIDAISSIANLSNPKNYKSTTGDWDQVLAALRKAVDNLEARVRSPEEAAPVFELREEEE
jgi:hypothetical protein